MKHYAPTQVSYLTLTLGFLITLFFSSLGYAQEQASNKDVGIFLFEEEVIDYGTIHQNDNGTRTFKFKNRGRAPIVISKVKTSCGCTVPTYPKQAILPGESGTIEIKYATNKIGKFSKSITVISNANNNQKKLRIIGEVIKNANSK
ncbi:DUF1573 domain-containing protein [uncultured Psychroserpens sp.]|uniref:DUF1573 domain-containing protein n=1 Tax=uncultured Psychroserpens sp. TaxID=255436 RepID=UPI00260B23E3|nr:DUF1573 domain-containing protein [uncultured Psychroserpens sp.]